MTGETDQHREEIRALVRHHLADPSAGWSIGTYGAIAEFLRDPDEPLLCEDADAVATARGAIRIAPVPGIQPLAYEGLSRRADAWTQSVALCLPAERAARSARRTLAEIGPDADAVRPEDRDAVLFDLGVGAPHIDFCVRTADAALARVLRRDTGRPVLAPGSPAMAAILAANPHRVARSCLGRIEVFQRIGVHDEKTGAPVGPHTHLLPRLLATGRSHVPTAPVPDGMLAAAEIYPGNPVADSLGQPRPFDPALHAAFQSLLARYGNGAYLDTKAALRRAVRDGAPPEAFAVASPLDRRGVRVGLRQLGHGGAEAERLALWRACFEAARAGEGPVDGH